MNRRRLLLAGAAALVTARRVEACDTGFSSGGYFGQPTQCRSYSNQATTLRADAIKAAAGSLRLVMRHSVLPEAVDVNLLVGDQFDEAACRQCDRMFRDWRSEKIMEIDRELLRALAHAQQELGVTLQLNSGFRTKKTQALLRQQGLSPANNSFHLKGKAGDIVADGIPAHEVATVVRKYHDGGIGIYDSFVHIDTGPPRLWRG